MRDTSAKFLDHIYALSRYPNVFILLMTLGIFFLGGFSIVLTQHLSLASATRHIEKKLVATSVSPSQVEHVTRIAITTDVEKMVHSSTTRIENKSQINLIQPTHVLPSQSVNSQAEITPQFISSVHDNGCTSKVVHSSWEPRPENGVANHTKGIGGTKVDGASERWNSANADRIDGNFMGTTDEIIQWGSCKWGFKTDVVRAVAVQESWWRQSTIGDADESYGLLQVRRTYHLGTFPTSQNSTAFNVDYALAWRKACMDGEFTWLGEKYQPGDEWGCVGAWFSGKWYDGDPNTAYSGANWYIRMVQGYLKDKKWLQSSF